MALILLPVIAFASPPDPSWIAGIYDGADGDDVVTFVYETVRGPAEPGQPVQNDLTSPSRLRANWTVRSAISSA